MWESWVGFVVEPEVLTTAEMALVSALSFARLPISCMIRIPEEAHRPVSGRGVSRVLEAIPCLERTRWERLSSVHPSNHPGFCQRDPGEGLLLRARENQLCLRCRVRRRPVGALPSRGGGGGRRPGGWGP